MISLRSPEFVATLTRQIAAVVVVTSGSVNTDDFESYSVGAVGDGSSLTGGVGWNGATLIVSWVPIVATEDFESYSVGAVFNGSNLTNGANWNGAPVIWNY